MFDFELKEDVQAIQQVLPGLVRERPWLG